MTFKRRRNARGVMLRRGNTATAFSLIELLTVIFIISMLIGILIPSINSARNAAKKAVTAKAIDAIRVGLEMFKNDNESDFRLTNGYPPSFSYPKIPGYNFKAFEGQFPFLDGVSNSTPPVVYGAHWLPAMLMGTDSLGYIKKSSVPSKGNLRREPWRWYTPDPLNDGTVIERQPLYLDPGGIKTLPTNKLPGRPPEELNALFPDWDNMEELPVIVDSFDQPILYYVASAHGKTTNMVEEKHLQSNADYSRGTDQQEGVPFFFHQDNLGFTGFKESADDESKTGWDFGNRIKSHAIAYPGDKLVPDQLIDPDYHDTFARYIVDRKIYSTLVPGSNSKAPLRPVSHDSFLLISAGPDGRYGTTDDVSNLPRWPD